jgi:hypothetical protein
MKEDKNNQKEQEGENQEKKEIRLEDIAIDKDLEKEEDEQDDEEETEEIQEQESSSQPMMSAPNERAPLFESTAPSLQSSQPASQQQFRESPIEQEVESSPSSSAATSSTNQQYTLNENAPDYSSSLENEQRRIVEESSRTMIQPTRIQEPIREDKSRFLIEQSDQLRSMGLMQGHKGMEQDYIEITRAETIDKLPFEQNPRREYRERKL